MSDKVQDRASSIGNVDGLQFRPNIQTVTLPCYCRWFGSRQQLEHHSTFLVPLRPCSSVSLALNSLLGCNASCHCPRRCCHTRRVYHCHRLGVYCRVRRSLIISYISYARYDHNRFLSSLRHTFGFFYAGSIHPLKGILQSTAHKHVS